MPSYRRLLAAMLAAASAVHASPAPVPAPAADTTTAPLAPTNAWVSVDSNGTPKTITPLLTTISGTPTVLSAKPTVSGTASSTEQPEATATNGAGSFPVCNNANGDLAPFCAPSNGTTLNPGITYYVTWDPSFFSAMPNTTVIITGNFFNDTTGAITTQAFSSGTLAAGWSFYAWDVEKSLLSGATSAGVNIRISMAYLSTGNNSTHVAGPVVTVANPQPYRQKPAEAPSGMALYIGLPCILGFVALMLIGTCIWNHRTRRIGLGNVMGRSRFGKLGELGQSKGYGVRKSRRQRVGAVNLDSKDAIDLQNREARKNGSGSGGNRGNDDGNDDGYDDFGMSWSNTNVGGRGPSSPYADAPRGAPAGGPPTLTLSGDHWSAPQRPRRDSDLGSLAGTPTDERFDDANRPRANNDSGSTGNAFRDELRRQKQQQDNLL
ncbi:uncharacterized protein SPSK_05278 [Sporothrix schenckii 1099-18]|uniref:Uncharacterized protein n=1 Tax=Sporothrix schenckii 1099-18 TaxID=1397361 RepID=A0A0F2LTS1_SPOSC|nr:uncharacterized protein SPSK_05278 [Sporothrix schenckii 1099-18]KJR80877.1 hypothetical protein SPSK_05278 [Sporothrix schenckii 1099-18]